ncbi:MAG: DUF3606 domain-containing protein [Bacteroidetes bacterium]|nr:DUF3606 domain-containing protein [Bacteroidota bacterium]
MPPKLGTDFYTIPKKHSAMDNKELKGRQDRERVSGSEDYELQYLAEQTNSTPEEVQKAIAEVGTRREDVVNYLSKHKDQ